MSAWICLPYRSWSRNNTVQTITGCAIETIFPAYKICTIMKPDIAYAWCKNHCKSLEAVTLCLYVYPCCPHHNYDCVQRRRTRRLNSSPQQFNLTKCPFIMCAVGLQHTSRLNTADLADLVRDTSKVSTSSSAPVITSNSWVPSRRCHERRDYEFNNPAY